MKPMILPYVDSAPPGEFLLQARALVKKEAVDEDKVYSEKIQSLQDQQRSHMEEYNLFWREMHTVQRELHSSLASQNSLILSKKRSRSIDTTADCEILRFEGMLTESLSLELILRFWDDRYGNCTFARMALEALQSTQEALRFTRRRIEEINALRFLEQQQCAKVLSDKKKLASRRLEKISALENLLFKNEKRCNSSLLTSLD
ncbi:uncharacterized protein TM35_000172770 [Trypanosoma theileri]|uniref:Uncharacterized protein n=1 Tax=Trypanosoma theileri TaxID=67003 RepID=A0A1X0NUN5_9TRYP|nr:uncharacterized protein TM35_000172770 [Trypanosoma theileri]ORC88405.1 hypothetical protein TM35_000172770 [Trypanosoma theileri]